MAGKNIFPVLRITKEDLELLFDQLETMPDTGVK